MAAKAIALLPTSLRRWAQARYRRGLTTRASPDSEAGRGPVLGRATAQEGEGCSCSRTGSRLAGDAEAGETLLWARLAAMEMELEALKRGSDGGASQIGEPATGELAELEGQTAAITEPSRRAVVARAPSPQSRLTWHGPP